MDKLYKLLSLIQSNEFENQRDLAQKTKLSVGTINALLKSMEKETYITVEKQNNQFVYHLTKTGLTMLENMMLEQKASKLKFPKDVGRRVTTAVILAAGQSQDLQQPAGMYKINEITIIDRMVEMLRDNGITKIVLVVGYQAEMYRNHFHTNDIVLITNEMYERTGTMHSLSLVKDVIDCDFLLVESDQIFEERAIIEMLSSAQKVSILVTPPQGSGDEAYVELDSQGNLFRISKDIHQMGKIDGEMLGISKISYDLFVKMLEEYNTCNNPYINYEYILENISRLYSIRPHVIDDLLWCEIDNLAQYEKAKNLIYPHIKRKESAMGIHYAKETLKDILDIDDKDIQDISIGGGITNTNYKVTVKNEDYMLRIPGKGTEYMIDRKNERFNGKIGSLLGINCNLVYFNETTGVKLSEFIPDAETLTAKTIRMEHNFKMAAQLLRKLHTSGVDFPNNFDVFAEAEKYEKALYEMNGSTYDGYETAKQVFLTLEKRLYNKLNFSLFPCHCDLVPDNLVKSGPDKMYLIDWEYAGMNDPMWDLAALFLESEFKPHEAELVLQYYFGRPATDLEREKILVFMICQDFLWALWTNIKEAKGLDYGSYGIDRFRRCQRYIKVLEQMYG